MSAPARHSTAVQRAIAEAERMLPPADFLRLQRGGPAQAPDVDAALAGTEAGRFLESCAAIEPYTAEAISPDVTLYRGDASPGGRRLLVALTGRMLRMSLPTAVFLQHLPASRWDVLMLRDPSLMHYRFGCPGYADDLPGLAGRVRALAGDYRETRLIGVSMGGLAAVQIAILAGGLPAVAIGAQPQSDIVRLFTADPRPTAFDPVCACLPRKSRPVIFCHAELHPEDSRVARALAALTVGQACAVPGTLRHPVMAELWQSGRLAQVLSALLAGVTTQPADLPADPPERTGVLARLHRVLRRG